MASPIDSIAEMPLWQRIVVWAVGGVLLGAVWYFAYFADVLAQRQQADADNAKAKTELAEMRKKKQNFEEEQRKADDDAQPASPQEHLSAGVAEMPTEVRAGYCIRTLIGVPRTGDHGDRS